MTIEIAVMLIMVAAALVLCRPAGAHTISMYQKAMRRIHEGTIDLEDDDLDIMLVSAGYTPSLVNDEFVYVSGAAGEIGREELNYGGGDTLGYYAGWGNEGSGRLTLASKAVTDVAAGAKFDAADVEWSSGLDAGLEAITYSVIIKRGSADDSDAIPIFLITHNPTTTPNGNPFKITWHSDGICLIRNAT